MTTIAYHPLRFESKWLLIVITVESFTFSFWHIFFRFKMHSLNLISQMDPISNEMKMNVFELIGRLALSTENYKKFPAFMRFWHKKTEIREKKKKEEMRNNFRRECILHVWSSAIRIKHRKKMWFAHPQISSTWIHPSWGISKEMSCLSDDQIAFRDVRFVRMSLKIKKQKKKKTTTPNKLENKFRWTSVCYAFC